MVPHGPHLQYTGTVFAMYQPFRVCGDDGIKEKILGTTSKLLFNFSEFFTTKVLIPEGQDPENTVCQKLDDGQQATLRSRLPVKNATSSKFPINPKKIHTTKSSDNPMSRSRSL
jgi:hypothetical protein